MKLDFEKRYRETTRELSNLKQEFGRVKSTLAEVSDQNRELRMKLEHASRSSMDNNMSTKGEIGELRERLIRANEEKENLRDLYLRTRMQMDQLIAERSINRRVDRERDPDESVHRSGKKDEQVFTGQRQIVKNKRKARRN